MEKLIAGGKRFVSLEKDKKWLENIIYSNDNTFEFIGIALRETKKLIGYISISEIDFRNGKCTWGGIKIDTQLSGKGYGFQSTMLLLKYVFEELRMERFHAECLEEHAASLNMMLKAGFVREGLLRNCVFKNGKQQNMIVLSMLRTEYLAAKEKYEL
jgi:RimJ/RimL family protein N-acetyltransferase